MRRRARRRRSRRARRRVRYRRPPGQRRRAGGPPSTCHGNSVLRPMTRLLLVRHGESEWNAVGRWQGWADPPLTELGLEQARLAAKAVGAVDLIVASDLERAWHTAEVIAAE